MALRPRRQLLIRGLALLLGPLAALTAPSSAPAQIGSVFGGDVSCAVQAGGYRFCGSSSPRSTTQTFDGVPIDVNVAFPPAPGLGSDGPYPLVMMFHGYAGSKLGFTAMERWLARGYATFSMTTRGFGESCGTEAARSADPTGCARGYVRLLDTRYEVRDAQELAGRLVDQGLVQARRIGATGPSYGGGLSMALAALRDRKMLPDGSLVEWTSPAGTPMELAAAVPTVPWTDLAYALAPNGSTLDYVSDSPYRGRAGVLKSSLVSGLYLLGSRFFYAPAGSDPDADLSGWFDRFLAGEPYDGDPFVARIISELTAHHSSYYIPPASSPAPLLIASGWTDDLFPADEAIRFYNRTTTRFPEALISLFLFDFGHPRGRGDGKPADAALLRAREEAWLDHFLKDQGPQPPLGVEALTQTCPFSELSGGPFLAASWAELAAGEVRSRAAAARRIEPGAGDPAVAAFFDPVASELSGRGACGRTAAVRQPGSATYRMPPARGDGFTLLGSPTVIADFRSPGRNTQIAARLFDVSPEGEQTLVARGLWRPLVSRTQARQVFQLHPNGWHFAGGHVAKLELLPEDAPYGRASNDQRAVRITNLELRLPVVQPPGALRSQVKAPAPKLVRNGYRLAAGFKALRPQRAELAPGPVEVAGNRILVRVACPASFLACRRGRIRVKGLPRGAPDFLAARRRFFARGGTVERVALPLRRDARRHLRRHRALRVRITIASAETTGAAVETRYAVR
jgi:Acetyl xylan esterase (AXE1)